MANNPNVNDPEILDGWADDADILGWDDNAGLMGFNAVSAIPGEIDPSSDPLGGPVGERVFLVTATLYPDWNSQTTAPAEASILATASYPTAGFPFGTDFGGAGPLNLRLADRDFVTLVDDPDLPSVWFDGRVLDAGSISRTLPLAPVGSSAIETTFGSVVIDNTDGAFDTLLDQNTAISQSLRIRGGRLGINVADFVTVFDARITGIGLSETQATLELQDPVVYAQNLYPTTVFTGLGGIGGDADLEGIVRPVVLGRVWNMSPVLINAVALIYQAHDGAIAAVSDVFDGGVALTFTADYVSYNALAAASLSGGQYATCLASGLIRVGGTPAFALTAHVDGALAAGTTVRSIAAWLIDQLGTQLEISVDASSFGALPAWTAGWVWNEEFTLADAISRFVGDGGYHWGADTDGLVRAVRLSAPDAGNIVATYDAADIVAIERTPLPQGYEGIHQRRQVRYLRNWTVQDDAGLAATAASRASRQREWRTRISTVAIASRNALDPAVLETSLYQAGHAQALADYLIGLHGVSRQMFSLETKIFGALPKVGDTVRVTYPRFALGDGRALRIVAMDLRLAENEVNLLLWG